MSSSDLQNNNIPSTLFRESFFIALGFITLIGIGLSMRSHVLRRRRLHDPAFLARVQRTDHTHEPHLYEVFLSRDTVVGEYSWHDIMPVSSYDDPTKNISLDVYPLISGYRTVAMFIAMPCPATTFLEPTKAVLSAKCSPDSDDVELPHLELGVAHVGVLCGELPDVSSFGG
ncbi:hypothetical protein C8R44DRAFT_732774 [Mycena epipterygia]|nr:hypothetical protein C8R44DRAFT_732774 [Mycena epipterygia]